jgi:outer membrane protein OmpA-like peptidoglycan-associated protein
MKLRLALAAATCLALPLAAHAQPVTGPYVSLEGGTSLEYSFDYNYPAAAGDTGKFVTRPSYAGAGSIGYGFGNGVRVELGGNFYRNTIAKNDSDDFGSTPATGGEEKYGPMVNVLYDISAGLPIFPYVGAGVGYQWVKFDTHINDVAGSETYVGGTKGSFAYDVIAGLAYPVDAVPGLSLTLEYRFMQLTASRNYTSEPQVALAPAGYAHIGGESSHSFLAGVRYQIFNAPPAPPMAPAPAPAPVAAPAPAPAKTYLVFFDWDKADLTPRATQIIEEAATDSKTAGVTTLSVSGYTDTSGTPVYNQGLSERRAKAVAGQLVADGVPESEIEIHAYGETHLLVPTGPGVREPQNRRVEIVLQ